LLDSIWGDEGIDEGKSILDVLQIIFVFGEICPLIDDLVLGDIIFCGQVGN